MAFIFDSEGEQGAAVIEGARVYCAFSESEGVVVRQSQNGLCPRALPSVNHDYSKP